MGRRESEGRSQPCRPEKHGPDRYTEASLAAKPGAQPDPVCTASATRVFTGLNTYEHIINNERFHFDGMVCSPASRTSQKPTNVYM